MLISLSLAFALMLACFLLGYLLAPAGPSHNIVDYVMRGERVHSEQRARLKEELERHIQLYREEKRRSSWFKHRMREAGRSATDWHKAYTEKCAIEAQKNLSMGGIE